MSGSAAQLDTDSRAAGPARHQATVRLQRTRGFGRTLSPSELWRYRDVAAQIARRDVKVRYRQTALGAAWAVLQPVGTMVVFTIFFGRLAHVRGEGGSYALSALAALVPWTYFQNALMTGSDSLISNVALVSKIYFPRIFIPAGVAAAGLVDLLVGSALLLVVVGAYGRHPSAGVAMLPVFALIAAAAALGVSSAASALSVRYRDVRFVVPFAAQLWLFLSPVAYPDSIVPEPWRTVYAINPMVGVIEGYRWAALGTSAPWTSIGISAAAAAVLLVGGLVYFERAERSFADVL
jgi:lipopolysaccharide transport system permease protein